MEGTFSYLVRRLLWGPPVLLAGSFATFAMARLGPGDPIRIAAGQFRDEEAFARIRQARGLDKPIYGQYVIYMKGILTPGRPRGELPVPGPDGQGGHLPRHLALLPVQRHCPRDNARRRHTAGRVRRP